MPESSLAVQLWTLRDLLKTPADIAATLKKVKALGYGGVELAGLGAIAPKELASILIGEGLTACATHTPLEKLRSNLNQVIDDHHTWGCKLSAVPIFRGSAAEFSALADELAAISAKFAAAGLRLGYHHHSHELVRHGRKTVLDSLIDKLPSPFWFEIDTYWVVHGGGDPVQWIGKVAGRNPCVHLKDMAIDEQGHQFIAEVGEGNLNWPTILGTCRQNGVQWYVVEQDVCRRNPLDCIGTSLLNLREMGLS